jgi:hypothetical protein
MISIPQSKYSNTYTVWRQNGTGLYKKIWQRMLRQRMYPLIDSPELGMRLVRDKRNVALIGGRETFFFDTQRFGKGGCFRMEKFELLDS